MYIYLAYVQGNALTRNVYIRTDRRSILPPGFLLKVVRPVYALSDAGDA